MKQLQGSSTAKKVPTISQRKAKLSKKKSNSSNVLSNQKFKQNNKQQKFVPIQTDSFGTINGSKDLPKRARMNRLLQASNECVNEVVGIRPDWGVPLSNYLVNLTNLVHNSNK